MRPPLPPSRNQSCPCGSGEKFKRCCGKQAAPQAGTRPVGEQLALLAQEISRGRGAACHGALTDLVARHPRHALAHYLLGHAAQAAGRLAEAAAAMERALDLGLDDPAAPFHLARVQVALNDLPRAEQAFALALKRRPAFPEAAFGLANCAFVRQDFERAWTQYRDLFETGFDPPELLHNWIQSGLKGGRWDARRAIALLTEQARHDAASLALLASLQESVNDLGPAEEHTTQALAQDPANALARITAARIALRRRQPEAVLALTAPESLPANDIERLGLLALRGQALEALARPDQALAVFHDAKALQRRRFSGAFDRAGFIEALRRHRHHFAQQTDPGPERIGPSATPVFIVGFYRCGSTLIEQMLSMHPDVEAFGESTALAQVESRALAQPLPLTDAPRRALREDYLHGLTGRHDVSDAPRILLDKQLVNQLRLPLIRHLFPDAKILHVLRHPLDSALSSFAHLFDDHPAWSTDLLDLAAYYASSWDHVAQCRRDLPASRYFAVRYEDLVDQPETTLRQITQFLDLPWTPALLAFHQSTRVVRTSSYAQVTRELYRDARFKYPAYLPHLAPDFLAAIDPVVRAMDYAI